MRYDLVDQEQGTALMQSLWPQVKAALSAGRKLTLEVKDASKSREQERLYHELIGQIAKQAQHMGSKWSAEDWKRLLVDKFMREYWQSDLTIIPNLDSTGIVQLGIQTRNFTKEQASEFVEFLQAWAVNNGVTIDEKTK